MDNDCDIEVKGNHLMFETKEFNAPVPDGQRYCLRSHWAKGRTTVVILWGNGKRPPFEVEIWYPGGKEVARHSITLQELQDFTFRWAKWADKNPSPFQWNG